MGVRSGVEVKKAHKTMEGLAQTFMSISYDTRSMINTISIAEVLLDCLFVCLFSLK